ncbi:MAG: helix-turn-helix domain-containing protein [Eubacteriales bacterium]|nr:helix-turn-helix domain-containing protein [Eubacteriales bacterium]
MLRYKINVSDALARAGVNKYKAKKTKVIGQDTLNKIAEENVTGITLKTLNTICAILELQPKDILEYVETSQDKEDREKIKS